VDRAVFPALTVVVVVLVFLVFFAHTVMSTLFVLAHTVMFSLAHAHTMVGLHLLVFFG